MTGSAGARPTIETIAARAGVSIASVSRVLNGLGGRPDTVRKVTDAAEALGYVPNAVARSLKARRTQQITFAMADIGNPVYVAMVRAIQREAKAAGYRVLLHSTDADIDEELAALRGLAHRHSDGMILCPLRITPALVAELEAAAGPVVVIGGAPGDTVPVDHVRADSVAGSAMAVRHLAEQGCRRIGFVNGVVDTVPGRSRADGYRRGLRAAGLPVDPDLTEVGEFQIEDGARATERLLARAPDLDGLFCANDLIALGTLRTLRAAGRSVPGDVAVCGMDDTELAEAAWPPLTSVDLGSSERGRLAARLLLDRLGPASASGAPAPGSASGAPVPASAAGTSGSAVAVRELVEPRLCVRASSVRTGAGEGR